MSLKKRKALGAVAAMALLSMTSIAEAGTIASGQVTLTYKHDAVVTLDLPAGSNITVYAGAAIITNPTGTLDSYLPDSFLSFCVDLYQILGSNPQEVELDMMQYWEQDNGQLPPQAGQRASYLYQTFVPTLSIDDSAASKAARAGLQVAIWNALYDNDYTVSTGGFHLDAGPLAVIQNANNYLTSLQGAVDASGGVSGYDNYWLKITKGTTPKQDFIGPAVPVPESSETLALLVVGLLGFVATWCRSHKTQGRNTQPKSPRNPT
jgi:hypothetical protein